MIVERVGESPAAHVENKSDSPLLPFGERTKVPFSQHPLRVSGDKINLAGHRVGKRMYQLGEDSFQVSSDGSAPLYITRRNVWEVTYQDILCSPETGKVSHATSCDVNAITCAKSLRAHLIQAGERASCEVFPSLEPMLALIRSRLGAQTPFAEAVAYALRLRPFPGYENVRAVKRSSQIRLVVVNGETSVEPKTPEVEVVSTPTDQTVEIAPVEEETEPVTSTQEEEDFKAFALNDAQKFWLVKSFFRMFKDDDYWRFKISQPKWSLRRDIAGRYNRLSGSNLNVTKKADLEALKDILKKVRTLGVPVRVLGLDEEIERHIDSIMVQKEAVSLGCINYLVSRAQVADHKPIQFMSWEADYSPDIDKSTGKSTKNSGQVKVRGNDGTVYLVNPEQIAQEMDDAV